MKKMIILSLFIMLNSGAYAVLFRPGSDLFMVETDYFRLIYSDETRPAAAEIMSYCDEMYEEINGILQRQSTDKITVVISDDYETANGMSIPVPYSYMLLYTFPVDTDQTLGNQDDFLYNLFKHELVHSISLTIRSDFMETGYKIFGSWVLPQMYMQPWFMIEGVTVSFESLEGEGRANDPLVYAGIAQDIVEGEFKNLSQVSGAYSLYPGGGLYYHYGGYFSRYLQNKYGMELYSELWRKAGEGNLFIHFAGVFKRNYGLPLNEEWEYFKDYMTLDDTVIENTNRLIEDVLYISEADNRNGYIYYYDYLELELVRYDVSNHIEETVINRCVGLDYFDLSPDGDKILLSYTVTPGRFPEIMVKEFDIPTGKFTDFELEDVYDAAYFSNGIVGIRPDLTRTDLIYYEDGRITNLLSGDWNQAIANPQEWNEQTIVMIISDHGTNKIISLDVSTGKLTAAEFGSVEKVQSGSLLSKEQIGDLGRDHPLTGSDITDKWSNTEVSHIRWLNVVDGDLLFGYNNGSSLYQLGWIDNAGYGLMTNQISGGVALPMKEDGAFYYIGSFSEGNSVMKLDEDSSQLAYVGGKVKWTEWTQTEDEDDETVIDEETKYKPGWYFLPHVWLPNMQLTPNLHSFGIYTYINDPIQANTLTADLQYNIEHPFANASLNWNNTALPFTINARLRDWLGYGSSAYRSTSGSLSLSLSGTSYPSVVGWSIAAGISHSFIAPDDGSKSAYGWEYQYQNTIASGLIGFSTLIGRYGYYNYSGVILQAYYDHHLQSGTMKAEASLSYAPRFLKAVLSINGAWSSDEILNPGGYNEYFGGNRYAAFSEYYYEDIRSSYYVSARLNVLLLNFEIQQGLGTFPFYINGISLFGGYRAAYLDNAGLQYVTNDSEVYQTVTVDDDYLHSVYLRLTLRTTVMHQLAFNPYFEVNYRINDGKFAYAYYIAVDTSILTGYDDMINGASDDEIMFDN